MITLTTGPLLRRRIEWNLRCMATYRYVDANGKLAPEYDATHLLIRAFYTTMNRDKVDGLAESLAAMPGCVSIEKIKDHATLRPQVLARFDRSVAS